MLATLTAWHVDEVSQPTSEAIFASSTKGGLLPVDLDAVDKNVWAWIKWSPQIHGDFLSLFGKMVICSGIDNLPSNQPVFLIIFLALV
jgi:hypothetical protein